MSQPATLTEVIARLQIAIQVLPWAEKVYGRVALHADQHVGQDRPQPRPMAFDPESKEYVDARPSDKYSSVVFFASNQPEKNDFSQERGFGHVAGHIGRPRRPLSIYGWVNLEELPDYDDGSGFPELIKHELKAALKQMTICVASLGDYNDGSVEDVFKPFQISDLDRRYDRWPYVAFRQDLVVYYIEKR